MDAPRQGTSISPAASSRATSEASPRDSAEPQVLLRRRRRSRTEIGEDQAAELLDRMPWGHETLTEAAAAVTARGRASGRGQEVALLLWAADQVTHEDKTFALPHWLFWAAMCLRELGDANGLARIRAALTATEPQGNNLALQTAAVAGSSGEEAQARKFSFMKRFMPRLEAMKASGREFVLCGDWNIAHREIDLKNWRSNQKSSGFLPEERAWLTRAFDKVGWVDVFRALDPRPEQYTWWSNRGRAWEKNVGCRLDYQIATPGIARAAAKAGIYTARRFSDHAPLTIDYDHVL